MTKYGWRNNDIIVDDIEIKNKLKVTGKIPFQYVIPKTVAYSTAAIMSAEDVNAQGTTAYGNADMLIQPPYPMQINVTANVAGTAGNTDALSFVGVDAKGDAVTESLVISSTATTTNTSSNAFANITSITPNTTVVSTGVGIGLNNEVIGLPYQIAANTDILSYTYDGVFSTAAASGLTVSATYDTLTLSGTAASKTVQVLYDTQIQG